MLARFKLKNCDDNSLNRMTNYSTDPEVIKRLMEGEALQAQQTSHDSIYFESDIGSGWVPIGLLEKYIDPLYVVKSESKRF